MHGTAGERAQAGVQVKVRGQESLSDVYKRQAKDCPHIICVKEAGGSVDRVNQLMQVVPEDFTVLCGDDGLTAVSYTHLESARTTAQG